MAGTRATAQIDEAVILRAKQKIQERAKTAKSQQASVGIHAEDGAEKKIDYSGRESTATLVEVAAAHEFGIGVPNRSWLRTWFDQGRRRLEGELTSAARKMFKGAGEALSIQAAQWATELREWIEFQDGKLERLSPVTIERKTQAGLESPTTPLLATGQLAAAIKAKVDGSKVE